MDPILLIIIVAVAAALIVGGGVWTFRRRSQLPAAVKPAALPAKTLADRLGKSRQALGDRLRAAFGREDLDSGFWEAVEEALIAADVGVATSSSVVAAVRRTNPEDADAAKAALREEMLEILAGADRSIKRANDPSVMMVVGVNGVGKTTTIAKLAARLREEGAESLLGAADTFRAAADTQLRTWADRVGVDIVAAESGSDPASVAFDAYQAAKSRGKDVLIVDTAGRLHSKANLMAELAKINRVLEGAAGSIDEVLLVLDATTGQNGVAQTKQFTETVGVTGVVLTKMDGTAKGGIAIAVEKDLGIPVKFIGVGEGIDDLVRFDPREFVDALLADA